MVLAWRGKALIPSSVDASQRGTWGRRTEPYDDDERRQSANMAEQQVRDAQQQAILARLHQVGLPEAIPPGVPGTALIGSDVDVRARAEWRRRDNLD